MKQFGLGLCLALGLSLTTQSFALTSDQKKELYEHGTITKYDEKGHKVGHWEVRFMPGAEHVTDDAAKHWEHAGELLSDFTKRETFWRKKFVGSFLKGVHYMKQTVCDDGVGSIPDSFKDTRDKNDQLTGTFAANAKKLKNWLEFGATCVKDVVVTAVGTPIAAVYTVLAPTAHVIFRPVAAATEAVVAGAMWPVLRYSWNGTAWVLAQGGQEPKAGDMTVTFVPENVHQDEIDHASAVIAEEEEMLAPLDVKITHPDEL